MTTGVWSGVLRTPEKTGRLCPVRALLAWRTALARDLAGQQPTPPNASPAASVSGPVFRPITQHGHAGVPGRGRGTGDRLSGATIAEIIKRRARAAGLDPAVLAAHSLRSGHATQAQPSSRSPHNSVTSTCRPPAATSAAPELRTTAPVATWACDQ